MAPEKLSREPLLVWEMQKHRLSLTGPRGAALPTPEAELLCHQSSSWAWLSCFLIPWQELNTSPLGPSSHRAPLSSSFASASGWVLLSTAPAWVRGGEYLQQFFPRKLLLKLIPPGPHATPFASSLWTEEASNWFLNIYSAISTGMLAFIVSWCLSQNFHGIPC